MVGYHWTTSQSQSHDINSKPLSGLHLCVCRGEKWRDGKWWGGGERRPPGKGRLISLQCTITHTLRTFLFQTVLTLKGHNDIEEIIPCPCFPCQGYNDMRIAKSQGCSYQICWYWMRYLRGHFSLFPWLDGAQFSLTQQVLRGKYLETFSELFEIALCVKKQILWLLWKIQASVLREPGKKIVKAVDPYLSWFCPPPLCVKTNI